MSQVAFWLMDKEMYDGMSLLTQANSIVDRGKIGPLYVNFDCVDI
jgi:hypothetical protein